MAQRSFTWDRATAEPPAVTTRMLVKGLPRVVARAALAAVLSIGGTAAAVIMLLWALELMLGPVAFDGSNSTLVMTGMVAASLAGAAVGAISGSWLARETWPIWPAGVTAYILTAMGSLKADAIWGLLHIGLFLAFCLFGARSLAARLPRRGERPAV